MKCNNCNQIIPDDSMFCKYCGSKITIDNSTIECPSCHNQIPADSKFCPDCGSKISVSAETKANMVVNNNNEPQEDPLNYLFPYIDKGKVGFKSLINNNVYIPAKYEDAREFHEGFAAVKTNGKWGYMDKSGKWVLPAKEEWVEDVKGGVAITGSGSRYKAGDCLMNFWSTINWQLIETGLYTSHSDFKDGVCQVWDDGKSHYFSDNEDGEEQILLPWRHYYDGGYCIFDPKHIAVKKHNLYGIIELYDANDGSHFGYREIVPCKYHHFGFTIGKNEVIIVNENRKSGVLSLSGREIVPMKYDVIHKIADGLIPVAKNGKIGYLDMQGQERIPIVYEPYDQTHLLFDILEYFKNGFVKVRHNGKIGLLDTNGNTIIPFMYDAVLEGKNNYFPNGLMAVSQNGKWGFINQTNSVIIDMQFDSVSPFNNGISIVKNGDKYGAINTQGEFVIPIIYDAVEKSTPSLNRVRTGNENYIVDNNNNRLPYEEIYESKVAKYRTWVRCNNKWGMVNMKGELIHECIFNAPTDIDMQRITLSHSCLPKFIYNERWYCIDYFGGITEN